MSTVITTTRVFRVSLLSCRIWYAWIAYNVIMYVGTFIISHNKSFNEHHHSSSRHLLKTEEESNKKFTSPNKYTVRFYDLKKFDDLPVHQSTTAKILNSSSISQVFNPSKNLLDYGPLFYTSGVYDYNTLKNWLLINIKSPYIYFKITSKHSWPYSEGRRRRFRKAFIYYFTFISGTYINSSSKLWK